MYFMTIIVIYIYITILINERNLKIVLYTAKPFVYYTYFINVIGSFSFYIELKYYIQWKK